MNDALGLKLPQFMENPRDEGLVSTIGMDGGEAPWETVLSCNRSLLACSKPCLMVVDFFPCCLPSCFRLCT